MLDSSPIRGPTSLPEATQAPPPKKLKRSASVASLPSPPPTVQPPRKRAGRIGLKPRKNAYAGDSDAEDGGDDDEDDFLSAGVEGEGDKSGVLGRMILFPSASSLELPKERQVFVSAVDGNGDGGDEDDPFVVRGLTTTKPSYGLRSGSPIRRSLSPVRRSPRLQAAANIAPVPVTPVKARSQRSSLRSPTRQSTRASAKKNKDEDKGICKPLELPVIDDVDDNPFFVKTPKNKKSASKGRAKVFKDANADNKEQADKLEKTEKPTVVYVFKGVKTHLPNPYYNLSPSAYERAKLPLDHPDYEPLPAGPSKLDFKPMKRGKKIPNGAMDGGSGHTAVTDDDEEEEEDEEADGEAKGEFDEDDHPSSNYDSSPRPPEPRTPENKPRVKYSGFKSVSGKPVLDSGPEGVRGSVMDPDEVGRMAVGPARDGGGGLDWHREQSKGSDI